MPDPLAAELYNQGIRSYMTDREGEPGTPNSGEADEEAQVESSGEHGPQVQKFIESIPQLIEDARAAFGLPKKPGK
jgi:hypothetical protein